MPQKGTNAVPTALPKKKKTGRVNRFEKVDECKGWKLLHQTHELDEWAFFKAYEEPGLVDIIQSTRKFLRIYLLARFVWAAVQRSARRTVSGKKSAIEMLERKIPRSTLYKFLNEELGLTTEIAMDEFRECQDMEEVVAACPHLKELAIDVEQLYEKHKDSIIATKAEMVEE